MNPTISIIVPVYNAERYLHRCLDSILAQTFKDFEVICIDDGSPDKSGEILDEYAKSDGRFKIIHQENAGVSAARQKGLDSATGEFVIHADPDDWVEPDWLEVLYEEAKRTKADITICDYYRIIHHKVVLVKQKISSLENEDLLEDLLWGRIWGLCWNKLVRRECFYRYNISFNPEMNFCEDLYVNCLLLTHDTKVSYISRALYHYDSVINSNSIVRFTKDSHIRSCMIFINEIEPRLHEDRYKDAWFYRKLDVKEMVMEVPNSKFSVRNIFPEINSIVIEKYEDFPLKSKERCVVLCLQGHEKIGRIMYFFITKLKKRTKLALRRIGI